MSQARRHTASRADNSAAAQAPGSPGWRPGGAANGQVAKPRSMRIVLRRLWSWLLPDRRPLAIACLAVVGSSAISLAAPYGIGLAVDAMELPDGVDFRLLKIIAIALVVGYAAEAALALLQGRVMAAVSQRVVRRLRQSLFDKLQRLPLGFFDSRPHGDTMSRLTNDIDNVSSSLSQPVVQFVSGLIAIVGSLVMMLALSPALTAATLITVPLVYGLVRVVTTRTRMYFKSQQAELGKLNGHIEETVTGIATVKAYNREERIIRQFDEANGRLFESGLRAQIWSGYLMPLLGVINNVGFTTLAVAGGLLAVKGHISVGVIASFMTYSRQFVRPLNDIANLYNVLQAGAAGAERVFEVLDEAEEPADRPGAVALTQPRGAVEFDGVRFAYREDAPVLDNVSFTVRPGMSIALVGPTGAGKTTVVNLLTRFYDVTGGAIRIDGRDIRDYTRDSLRRCFGVVLQDTYLFAGTIRDNLRYGKPDATEAELRAAAAMAGADRFIARLPQQYDTLLLENGSNLSQGEKQLLAIARVMLTDPPILILDEATSSIDTRTELRIQAALLKLMDGRTSFLIAHRLNTIRGADLILVIDGGKIAEAGSHEDLLRQGGLYSRMYQVTV